MEHKTWEESIKKKTWEEFQKDEITIFALSILPLWNLTVLIWGLGRRDKWCILRFNPCNTQVQSLYNNKLLNPQMNSAIISLVWSNDFISRFMVFAC